MPHPSTSLATLRPELGGSLMEFDLAADRMRYIGHRIFPRMSVGKPSGTFGRIPIEQLLQTPDDARAPGSAFNRGKWTFEEHSFTCSQKGWEEPVDDVESSIYSDYFDAEQVSTQRAMGIVTRNMEKRIAAKVHDTTVYTPTGVGTAWSDHANATPLDNIETLVLAVYNTTGLWPNAIQMNRLQFRHLRRCVQVKDEVASNGAGESSTVRKINEQKIAELVDLDHVLVAGGSDSTAPQGLDVSIGQIWSNSYVWVGRIATTNDIQEPCVGRTFHYDEFSDNGEPVVESYRDETIAGDVVRVRNFADENRIHEEAGGLLSGVI